MSNYRLQLLSLFGLPASHPLPAHPDAAAPYWKDLYTNLRTALHSDSLTQAEVYLLATALAHNAPHPTAQRALAAMARRQEVSEEAIGAAVSTANHMRANNILFRYKHYLEPGDYDRLPARLRFSREITQVLGKEPYELICLAVSAVNGCSACCRAHEQYLRRLDCPPERIFQAVRLASVLSSAFQLL